jgi:hypothetical protein
MAIIVEDLIARIEALEQRVGELARLLLAGTLKGPQSFKDLYGCLQGKLDASDELLEECTIRLEWDKLLRD